MLHIATTFRLAGPSSFIAIRSYLAPKSLMTFLKILHCANYFALKIDVKKLDFFWNLFQSLKIQLSTRSTIYVDSVGLNHFIQKNSFTRGLTDIPFKLHQFKHHVRKSFCLKHVPGLENPANLLSKAIPASEIEQFHAYYFSS